MGDIIVAIDIGTSKVSTLVGRMNSLHQVDILGKGFETCTGVKKGTIVDIESTSVSIKSSTAQAEQMAGMKVKSAFVTISGLHLSVMNSRSWINITGEKREVTKSDVAQIMDDVRQMRIPEDTYIIDVIPRQYIIDECEEIVDPVGMAASRLGVEADLILAKAASVRNIMKCMEKAEVKIEGLIVEGLSSGNMFLTQDEKQMGVLLIDIGGEITDATLFKNNNLLFSGTLPVGGEHITNDIAVGFKIAYAEAERFKKQYNLALTSLIKHDQEEIVSDISDSGKKRVKISEMVGIVEARVYEIFSLCKELLEKEGIDEGEISGVVLTGRGISYFDGAIELAGEVFGVPVRTVSLKGSMDIKLEHSTCVSVIKYASAYNITTDMVEVRKQERVKNTGKVQKSFGQKLQDIFKRLF